MPSPFPGMDPYLEGPEIFPDFHDSFITYLREALQADLPVPYFATLGRRVWIEASRRSIGPDLEVRRGRASVPPRAEPAAAAAVAVAVVEHPIARPVVIRIAHDEFREPFIEIYTRGEDGKRLVASLEVLSLANKTPGEHGRDLYCRKQEERLARWVHLVEFDFLRGSAPPRRSRPMRPAMPAARSTTTFRYAPSTTRTRSWSTRSASKIDCPRWQSPSCPATRR